MAHKSSSLSHYEKKRQFDATPEPSGRAGRKRHKRSKLPRVDRRKGERLFVIQQHDASTLHWDFRLELDGVLKSWAVPKGPSTDPREKRLAVAVEDHPMDYADFEGVIPEDQYGGGSVIVWDAGPYTNLTEDDDGNEVPLEEALRKGHADIRLQGRKLKGGYALLHSRMRGQDENWLLVKMKGEGADARRNPTSTQPESILTGRTNDEVAEEEGGEDT